MPVTRSQGQSESPNQGTDGQNNDTSHRDPDDEFVDAVDARVLSAINQIITDKLSQISEDLNRTILNTITTAIQSQARNPSAQQNQAEELPTASPSSTRTFTENQSGFQDHRGESTRRTNLEHGQHTTFQGMNNETFQRTLYETPIRPNYSGTLPIHPIEPSKYSGDPKKARSWLREYSETCTINGYDNYHKKMRMVAYLTNEAKDWYYSIRKERSDISWEELQKIFLEDFTSTSTSKELFKILCDARQRKNERPFAFLLRIQRYCYDYNAEMPEKEVVNWCLDGLDQNIANTIKSPTPKNARTLNWLKEKLREWSIDDPEVERQRDRVMQNRNHVSDKANPTPTKPTGQDPYPRKSPSHPNWVCFNCNGKGHALTQCTRPKDDEAIKKNRARFMDARAGRFVQHINAPIENDEQLEKIYENDETDIPRENFHGANLVDRSRDILVVDQVIEHLPCDGLPKPTLQLKMNNKSVRGRLDCGADMTIIPEHVAKHLNLNMVAPKQLEFGTASATALRPIGLSAVTVEHNNRVASLLVAVVRDNDSTKVLWGIDVFSLFNLTLAFHDGHIKITEKQVMAPNALLNKETTKILNIERMRESQRKQELKPKLIYGEMDPDENFRLEQELLKYHDVFSLSSSDIGHTKSIQHKIPLTDNTPVFSKPYRVAFRHRQLLEDMLKEMQRAGIIRPSTSPYASPILFVDKPDGSKRLCVDYRKLNAISVRDRTPMPHPEDVFGMMSGVKIFTKLDITSMFWQIEVAPEDCHKTAFTTSSGLFEFVMMPFGLMNAPATAVRLMRHVLRDLDGKICYVYFDDILIFACNIEEMIERTTSVLQRIRDHEIKLKPSKCGFGLNSTTYLGQKITASGISLDDSRVEAVKMFPIPKDQHEVRSFHGLCSYNRRYVKGFADIAKPLTQLMKKGIEFIWSDECQKSFDTLKDRLISKPILVYFDVNSEHELRTDASAYGMGAILYQKSEITEKQGVILYMSKSLNKAQQNYSATERECLAAFWAITTLKHYLLGRKFTLITDHNPLSLLKNGKDPHQRLARWVAQLQGYDFDVKYKPGPSHSDADCLSRLIPENKHANDEIEEAADNIQQAILAVTFSSDSIDMIQEQRNDDFCNKLIKELESESENIRTSHFTIQNDLLYHKNANGDLQLVIPRSQTLEILKQCHDNALAGHMGLKRTYALIRERFFWRNMRDEIIKYVQTCDKCQKRKASNKRSQGFIEPIPIAEDVFDNIGIDLIDKLPISRTGKNSILVMTDNLSKYVVTVNLQDGLADTINTAIFEHFITKFGCPKTIISDRGSNLTSMENNNFFNSLGIKRITTTAYHPQANGQTERFNRVIGAQLAMFVEKSQRDWCKFVPALTFAYNVSKHSVTNVTPYELVFARKPRIPAENIFGRQQYINPNCPGLEVRAEEAKELIKQYIRKSQAKNKKRIDQTLDPNRFEVGDLVVIKRPTRVPGGAKKLTFTYIGPFRLTKKLNNLNFEVVNLNGRPRCFSVHPIHLRKYYLRANGTPPAPPAILTNYQDPVTENQGPEHNNLTNEEEGPYTYTREPVRKFSTTELPRLDLDDITVTGRPSVIEADPTEINMEPLQFQDSYPIDSSRSTLNEPNAMELEEDKNGRQVEATTEEENIEQTVDQQLTQITIGGKRDDLVENIDTTIQVSRPKRNHKLPARYANLAHENFQCSQVNL